MNSSLNRRSLLKGVLAAGVAPCAIASTAIGGGGRPPASERIAMGFVGVGSHGKSMNLRNALGAKEAQIVALCDCDARHLEEAYNMAKDADTHADWRELVERDDLDAVVVSTPDHWHVPVSLAAVRAGKDVMCEKPLTRTIHEGRVLSDAVDRYGCVFQTASEFRGLHAFHHSAELVRNERIGKLHTIRVSLGRQPNRPGNPETMPIPDELDYDMWLGPAPWAPYTKDRCHWNFRWILDYSGGQLTDWGGHLLDQAQWGNGTEYTGPVEVEGDGHFMTEGLFNTADKFRVEYRYANGVRMIVSDQEPTVGMSGAIRYEGSDGWITAKYPSTLRASSQEILESKIGPDEVHLYTCPGREMRNFLDCIRSRTAPYYPAEVGHRSISIAHLGNISMRLGRKLKWDPEEEHFVDDRAANRMLTRARREPWTL